MNKTQISNIKVYSSSAEATLLKQIFNNIEILITETKNNIFTISEEGLNKLKLNPNKYPFCVNENLFFWDTKIIINQRNKRVFTLSENDLLQEFPNNQKIEHMPQIEDLAKSENFNIIFNEYKNNYQTVLQKVKLQSFIRESFIDHIIGKNFRGSVINFNDTMWVYVYSTKQKIEAEEVIDYYQELFNVNQNIISKEEENITLFDFVEFIPTTENISFLGYQNGIYNPYKFTELDFRIEFYESIKENIVYTPYKFLEIKEKFVFDLSKIEKEISKISRII